MKDELGGQIMDEFEPLRPKIYSYTMHKSIDHKKSKIQNEVCHQTRKKNWGLQKFPENNKVVLRSQQRLRSKADNVFTEKFSKIFFSAYVDKVIQSPDEVISIPYGTGPNRVCKEEFMRHPKIKKLNIMINFRELTGQNRQGHNVDRLQTSHHSYRILIVGGFGLGKTNALLRLINYQSSFDNVCLYAKVLSEPKYQYLIGTVKKLTYKMSLT